MANDGMVRNGASVHGSPVVAANFWRAFGRALGTPIAPGRYARSDLPRWDSLRHVELMFELEETFGIQVPPEAIAELYSDTDTILAFLSARAERR